MKYIAILAAALTIGACSSEGDKQPTPGPGSEIPVEVTDIPSDTRLETGPEVCRRLHQQMIDEHGTDYHVRSEDGGVAYYYGGHPGDYVNHSPFSSVRRYWFNQPGENDECRTTLPADNKDPQMVPT